MGIDVVRDKRKKSDGRQTQFPVWPFYASFSFSLTPLEMNSIVKDAEIKTAVF